MVKDIGKTPLTYLRAISERAKDSPMYVDLHKHGEQPFEVGHVLRTPIADATILGEFLKYAIFKLGRAIAITQARCD